MPAFSADKDEGEAVPQCRKTAFLRLIHVKIKSYYRQALFIGGGYKMAEGITGAWVFGDTRQGAWAVVEFTRDDMCLFSNSKGDVEIVCYSTDGSKIRFFDNDTSIEYRYKLSSSELTAETPWMNSTKYKRATQQDTTSFHRPAVESYAKKNNITIDELLKKLREWYISNK